MKKNLLRKLTLSAVTMGVAALSVTTSTFAWFTTNGNATASTISGTVQSSDILFMIENPTWSDPTKDKPASASYDNSTYVSSVTLSQEKVWNGTKAEDLSTTSLYPVAIGGTASEKNVGTFTSVGAASGDGSHQFTKTADRSYYLHYQVRFALSQMDKSKTTTVKMDFSNLNVTASGTQTLLAEADSDTTTTKGDSVSRTIADVLSLGIKNTVVGSHNLTSDATGNYHYKEEKKTGCNTATTASVDAHTYYNNIFGLKDTSAINVPTNYASNYNSSNYFGSWVKTTTTDSSSSTTTTDGSYTLFSVTGVESIEVTTDFYFFIDGWDYDCFNCVGGLSFTANSINFTATQAATSSN